MKKLAILLALGLAVPAWAQTYVQPHMRKDGTYVEGHYRSSPNKTDMDNYSTKGNINPYTGQAGTQTPSYERQYQPLQSPSFGQTCHYTTSGRYVCR